MAAGRHDLTIEQGATFTLPITVEENGVAVDFGTGASARMQVRSSASSPTALVSLTSVDGDIAVTPASGQLVVTITAAVTAALRAGGVYDLEVVFGAGGDYTAGTVWRLLEGAAVLSLEVTR